MNLIGISGKSGSGKDTLGNMMLFIHEYKRFSLKPLEYAIYEKRHSNERFRSYIEQSEWKIKKYARKVKETVSILTGYTVNELELEEVKNSTLGKEWSYKRLEVMHFDNLGAYTTFMRDNLDVSIADDIVEPNINEKGFEIHLYFKETITVRQLLQWVGTDAMRDVIHKNVWINALFVDYNAKKLISREPSYAYTIDEFANLHSEATLPKWIITDVRFPNEVEAIKNRGGIVIRVIRDNVVSNIDKDHPSETALDDFSDFDEIIYNDDTKSELFTKALLLCNKYGL